MDIDIDRRQGYHIPVERMKGDSKIPPLSKSLESGQAAEGYLARVREAINGLESENERDMAWGDYDKYGRKLVTIAGYSDKGKIFPDADESKNTNIIPVTPLMYKNLEKSVQETRAKLGDRAQGLLMAGIAYSTRLSYPFRAVEKNNGFSYWLENGGRDNEIGVNGNAAANLSFALKYLDGKYKEISAGIGIRKPDQDDLKKLGINISDIPEEEMDLWGKQDAVNHHAEEKIIKMILHHANSEKCNPLEIMRLTIAAVNRVLNHGKILADEKLSSLERKNGQFDFEKKMGKVEGVFFAAQTGAQLARIVNIITQLRGLNLEDEYYRVVNNGKDTIRKTA